MKLSYSILWFDDDQDYIDSVDLEPIEEAIESWGFKPNIVMVSDPDEFMKHEPFSDFDLIAVDYNLEACEEHGENFIANIRSHGVYTEIVFYSANQLSDLWEAVKQKKLEGVFIASRKDGGEQTKIINVARQSVHKFLDLNNIRGVIMAEVGNIDGLLDTIAEKHFNDLDSVERLKLINHYVAEVSSQNGKRTDAISAFENTENVAELLESLESAKKWNFCQSLSKQLEGLDVNQLGNYQDDVLKPRNFLAHGSPELQGDGSLLFEHYGKSYIFNDKESVKLRNKLQYYSDKFSEILLAKKEE